MNICQQFSIAFWERMTEKALSHNSLLKHHCRFSLMYPQTLITVNSHTVQRSHIIMKTCGQILRDEKQTQMQAYIDAYTRVDNNTVKNSHFCLTSKTRYGTCHVCRFKHLGEIITVLWIYSDSLSSLLNVIPA